MEPVNLFVRGKDDSKREVNNRVWDDYLLIKAYDKAVSCVKEQISENLGLTNGSVENEKEPKGSKSSNKNCTSAKSLKDKKWKKGDFCRSVYSEDGIEYEATVLKILPNGQCLVKYVGYNNEEVVKFKNLKTSLGQDCRQKQQLAAAAENEISNASDVNSYNYYVNDGTSKTQGLSLPQWEAVTPTMVPQIPPPPAFHSMLQGSSHEESEALSAMLMSWYMSGYHTGFYQGMLNSKNQNINQTANSSHISKK